MMANHNPDNNGKIPQEIAEYRKSLLLEAGNNPQLFEIVLF